MRACRERISQPFLDAGATVDMVAVKKLDWVEEDGLADLAKNECVF
jgi:hypothetical protein